jgi:hypothetical protein
MTRLWRAAYLRAVASAFRTVPLYRERWALDGRTDPILVPGRTGFHQGAIPLAEALRRKADLVPLAGGPQWTDAGRGRPLVRGDTPLHHQTLGFLGEVRECGRLHLDWPRVYARPTTGGLAFTLLWQRSPRLVDILIGLDGGIAYCQAHGTPVVRP